MLPVSSDREIVSSLYYYYLHRIMPLEADKIRDFLFAYAAEDRKELIVHLSIKGHCKT